MTLLQIWGGFWLCTPMRSPLPHLKNPRRRVWENKGRASIARNTTGTRHARRPGKKQDLKFRICWRR
jgi:hypothetical protein